MADSLQRADFEAGGSFTASDLNLEHRYRTELLRRHLRFTHGWGVVCGLLVVAMDDPRRPWLIRVCPGYGVSPCGDELAVPAAIDHDLSGSAWTMPAGLLAGGLIYIGLRFQGTPSKPVLVEPGGGCGCGSSCDQEIRSTRARDGAIVTAGWKLQIATTPRFDLCSGDTPPCPPCPPACDLPLASILLPPSPAVRIDNNRIDNSIRKFL